MSLVYALVSYPAGVWMDRGRTRGILGVGMFALVVADLILARAASGGEVLGGVAVWGVHMGLTQGVLAALVAETAPPDLRGTAFGLFNLVSGAAMLVASGLAGWLWDLYGPARTFQAGAVFTLLAWSALLVQNRVSPRRK